MKKPVENQLLQRLRREAQYRWRNQYDDYKLLPPEIESIHSEMSKFAELGKRADELKYYMQGCIHRLRVFLPLLPDDTWSKMRRPDKSHSAEFMLMNLEDHIELFASWTLWRAREIKEKRPRRHTGFFMGEPEPSVWPFLLPKSEIEKSKTRRTCWYAVIASIILLPTSFLGCIWANQNITSKTVHVSSFYRAGHLVSGYPRRPPGSVRHDEPYETMRSACCVIICGGSIALWASRRCLKQSKRRHIWKIKV